MRPSRPCAATLGDRTSLFRTGPRKLLQDGSLGAKSAEMIAGYVDEPDNHGIPIHTEEELYELIRAAHRRRMDVAVHAIGDLALQKVCDAVERVQREDPWPQARHGGGPRPDHLPRPAGADEGIEPPGLYPAHLH